MDNDSAVFRFFPDDLDLWPWHSNSGEIYHANPTSFIVLRLVVRKLSCGQTHTLTNKQTPLKTSTSLRYATPVGKDVNCHCLFMGTESSLTWIRTCSPFVLRNSCTIWNAVAAKQHQSQLWRHNICCTVSGCKADRRLVRRIIPTLKRSSHCIAVACALHTKHLSLSSARFGTRMPVYPKIRVVISK